MTRPLALDLFCGAGGVSRGLHDAGFDVVGVDIAPQPNYPYKFVQADATTYQLNGPYVLVWASPPCQAYIRGGLANKSTAPRLIAPVRDRLIRSGHRWVIENVPGAPIRPDAILCGSQFGLQVRRHRLFEASFGLPMTVQCDHSQPITGVYGRPQGQRGAWPGMLPGDLATWSKAMGIDWMTSHELTQAIPPAYAEWIGRAALNARTGTEQPQP